MSCTESSAMSLGKKDGKLIKATDMRFVGTKVGKKRRDNIQNKKIRDLTRAGWLQYTTMVRRLRTNER